LAHSTALAGKNRTFSHHVFHFCRPSSEISLDILVKIGISHLVEKHEVKVGTSFAHFTPPQKEGGPP
jgi:hypothetical protein